MSNKIKCALIGPGNIGTDLLYKLKRSPVLEPVWMVGIDPESDGLKRAAAMGLKTTALGVDGLLPHVVADGIQIAFDATSAYVHAENSRKLNELGVLMIDLTPAAIGPYSQGIEARGARTVYLSGQIPLDPATGELVKGTIEEETTRALENVRGALGAAGAGLEHVVKTTVFLVDLADFARMNAVYGAYFAAPAPARSTVQVAALPRGARVEIEAIAVLD